MPCTQTSFNTEKGIKAGDLRRGCGGIDIWNFRGNSGYCDCPKSVGSQTTNRKSSRPARGTHTASRTGETDQCHAAEDCLLLWEDTQADDMLCSRCYRRNTHKLFCPILPERVRFQRLTNHLKRIYPLHRLNNRARIHSARAPLTNRLHCVSHEIILAKPPARRGQLEGLARP
jgi:hypothetical protein